MSCAVRFELRVAELGQKIDFPILRLTLDSRLAKPRFDNKTAHGITDDRLFHIACTQDFLCSSKRSNQGRKGDSAPHDCREAQGKADVAEQRKGAAPRPAVSCVMLDGSGMASQGAVSRTHRSLLLLDDLPALGRGHPKSMGGCLRSARTQAQYFCTKTRPSV